jgi:hypothetical protein
VGRFKVFIKKHEFHSSGSQTRRLIRLRPYCTLRRMP